MSPSRSHLIKIRQISWYFNAPYKFLSITDHHFVLPLLNQVFYHYSMSLPFTFIFHLLIALFRLCKGRLLLIFSVSLKTMRFVLIVIIFNSQESSPCLIILGFITMITRSINSNLMILRTLIINLNISFLLEHPRSSNLSNIDSMSISHCCSYLSTRNYLCLTHHLILQVGTLTCN